MAITNVTPGTITISGAEYVAAANQYVLYRGGTQTVTATLNDVEGLNVGMTSWTWTLVFTSGTTINYSKLDTSRVSISSDGLSCTFKPNGSLIYPSMTMLKVQVRYYDAAHYYPLYDATTVKCPTYVYLTGTATSTTRAPTTTTTRRPLPTTTTLPPDNKGVITLTGQSYDEVKKQNVITRGDSTLITAELSDADTIVPGSVKWSWSVLSVTLSGYTSTSYNSTANPTVVQVGADGMSCTFNLSTFKSGLAYTLSVYASYKDGVTVPKVRSAVMPYLLYFTNTAPATTKPVTPSTTAGQVVKSRVWFLNMDTFEMVDNSVLFGANLSANLTCGPQFSLLEILEWRWYIDGARVRITNQTEEEKQNSDVYSPVRTGALTVAIRWLGYPKGGDPTEMTLYETSSEVVTVYKQTMPTSTTRLISSTTTTSRAPTPARTSTTTTTTQAPKEIKSITLYVRELPDGDGEWTNTATLRDSTPTATSPYYAPYSATYGAPTAYGPIDANGAYSDDPITIKCGDRFYGVAQFTDGTEVSTNYVDLDFQVYLLPKTTPLANLNLTAIQNKNKTVPPTNTSRFNLAYSPFPDNTVEVEPAVGGSDVGFSEAEIEQQPLWMWDTPTNSTEQYVLVLHAKTVQRGGNNIYAMFPITVTPTAAPTIALTVNDITYGPIPAHPMYDNRKSVVPYSVCPTVIPVTLGDKVTWHFYNTANAVAMCENMGAYTIRDNLVSTLGTTQLITAKMMDAPAANPKYPSATLSTINIANVNNRYWVDERTNEPNNNFNNMTIKVPTPPLAGSKVYLGALIDCHQYKYDALHQYYIAWFPITYSAPSKTTLIVNDTEYGPVNNNEMYSTPIPISSLDKITAKGYNLGWTPPGTYTDEQLELIATYADIRLIEIHKTNETRPNMIVTRAITQAYKLGPNDLQSQKIYDFATVRPTKGQVITIANSQPAAANQFQIHLDQIEAGYKYYAKITQFSRGYDQVTNPVAIGTKVDSWVSAVGDNVSKITAWFPLVFTETLEISLIVNDVTYGPVGHRGVYSTPIAVANGDTISVAIKNPSWVNPLGKADYKHNLLIRDTTATNANVDTVIAASAASGKDITALVTNNLATVTSKLTYNVLFDAPLAKYWVRVTGAGDIGGNKAHFAATNPYAFFPLAYTPPPPGSVTLIVNGTDEYGPVTDKQVWPTVVPLKYGDVIEFIIEDSDTPTKEKRAGNIRPTFFRVANSITTINHDVLSKSTALARLTAARTSAVYVIGGLLENQQFTILKPNLAGDRRKCIIPPSKGNTNYIHAVASYTDLTASGKAGITAWFKTTWPQDTVGTIELSDENLVKNDATGEYTYNQKRGVAKTITAKLIDVDGFDAPPNLAPFKVTWSWKIVQADKLDVKIVTAAPSSKSTIVDGTVVYEHTVTLPGSSSMPVGSKIYATAGYEDLYNNNEFDVIDQSQVWASATSAAINYRALPMWPGHMITRVYGTIIEPDDNGEITVPPSARATFTISDPTGVSFNRPITWNNSYKSKGNSSIKKAGTNYSDQTVFEIKVAYFGDMIIKEYGPVPPPYKYSVKYTDIDGFVKELETPDIYVDYDRPQAIFVIDTPDVEPRSIVQASIDTTSQIAGKLRSVAGATYVSAWFYDISIPGATNVSYRWESYNSETGIESPYTIPQQSGRTFIAPTRLEDGPDPTGLQKFTGTSLICSYIRISDFVTPTGVNAIRPVVTYSGYEVGRRQNAPMVTRTAYGPKIWLTPAPKVTVSGTVTLTSDPLYNGVNNHLTVRPGTNVIANVSVTGESIEILLFTWVYELLSNRKKFLLREFAPRPEEGEFPRTDQATVQIHYGDAGPGVYAGPDQITGDITCMVTWSCLINGERKYFQTPKAAISIDDLL